jgi:hypothetical protein
MKRLIACVMIGFLHTISNICGAADNQDGEGRVTIFDGKSLDGWKISEKPESWKLEDGMIVAHGDRSHLFYVGDDKPFVNFEFKADVMTKPNTNSGIFIHTKFQSGKGELKRCQGKRRGGPA